MNTISKQGVGYFGRLVAIPCGAAIGWLVAAYYWISTGRTDWSDFVAVLLVLLFAATGAWLGTILDRVSIALMVNFTIGGGVVLMLLWPSVSHARGSQINQLFTHSTAFIGTPTVCGAIGGAIVAMLFLKRRQCIARRSARNC